MIAKVVQSGEPWPVDPGLKRFRIEADGAHVRFLVAAQQEEAEALYREVAGLDSDAVLLVIPVG